MGGVILKGTFSDRDPVVGGCAACVLHVAAFTSITE